MSDIFYFNPYAVPQLLVAMFMLIQGVLVLVQNPRGALNRSFFFWEFAVFVWLFGMGLAYLSKNESVATILSQVGFLGVMFIPISTYAFSVYFNDDKKQLPIVLVGFITTTILAMFINTDLIGAGTYHYKWGYYIRLGSLGYTALALYFLFVPLFLRNYYYRHKTAPANQKKWHFFNLLVGGLAFIAATDFLPAYGVSLPFPPVGFVFVGVFASLMGYFILRHQLTDIKIVFGRTIGYILMTLFLLLIYGAVYYLIGPKNRSSEEVFLEAVIFTMLLYVFGFVKSLSQKVVDELFFKEKVQFEKLIRGFISDVETIHNTDSLASILFSFVIDKLRIQTCSIYVYERNEKRWKVISSGKMGPTYLYKNIKNVILTEDVSKEKQRVFKRGDWTRNKNDVSNIELEANVILEAEDVDIALPFYHKETFIGFVVLGKKQSGESISKIESGWISEILIPLSITWVNSKQYEELKHANEFHSNLITILSHQLRTPLTRIKWAGDVLQKEIKLSVSKNGEDRAVREILESANTMMDITNQLLSSAEITNVPEKDEVLPVARLREIIETLITAREHFSAEKRISIKNNVSALLASLACGEDVARIVISVFLDNAIKYSKEGGEIVISGREFQNNYEISVADKGIGIIEAEQNKIFSKFFRGTNAKSLEPNGTGLGLYYSRALIERRGGSLWFRPNKEGGTTFFYSVPVAKSLSTI